MIPVSSRWVNEEKRQIENYCEGCDAVLSPGDESYPGEQHELIDCLHALRDKIKVLENEGMFRSLIGR